VVKVAITVDRAARTARVDFTGTSDQVPTNFNAPASICRAAALYVFRTLVDDEIPMNDGCLRPVELVIPEGSMLRPRYPAAVVAGNVETSQVVVDALYGALDVMAAAQGTMNNFTFGDDRRQYYETICGGAGAGPGLRRRRCGPDPHDQQPPDRSGSAGEPLSGAGRGLFGPARLRRRGRPSWR
jgi:5-oxoprolinase (ATP-hydrolysing)